MKGSDLFRLFFHASFHDGGVNVENDMKAEAKQILFDKLKEMSELEISDFYDDRCGYNGLCAVMCDIYKAITDTKENE